MKTPRTIIVTGASQGIGAGLVSRFLELGYNVVATSRQVSASKELPVSDRLVRVDGDVADPATADAVVEAAVKAFGSVDALVNNAGIFIGKPFADFPIEDYRQLQSINLDGFLFMTQRVVRQMLVQGKGGSIVSITSPLTNNPIAGAFASVAMMTKGGIEAGSRNIAMEYASQGIRVNIVAPGIVDTPMHAGTPKDALGTMSPIQGVSSVDEIVDAVVFVTEAPRVTGETVRVDGGGHMGKW
ncbi:SDR family oxidoreductase [Dyella dinghuensis]|uniref:SDR family oxidoreductase n=1 Tax=Dyella dinghuensis TaxID=1920169 RepID=A0A3S0QVS8_9GAMM|nr:SDR family oxidoreductase [Dyella dinghuensis]RUL62232.1 SDR family oxidoreductase [Dyella dinghuensis]